MDLALDLADFLEHLFEVALIGRRVQEILGIGENVLLDRMQLLVDLGFLGRQVVDVLLETRDLLLHLLDLDVVMALEHRMAVPILELLEVVQLLLSFVESALGATKLLGQVDFLVGQIGQFLEPGIVLAISVDR